MVILGDCTRPSHHSYVASTSIPDFQIRHVMNSDNEKLEFKGASPIIFFTTIAYAIPIIVINHFLKPMFALNFIARRVLIAVAILLLCLGIPMYFITLRILIMAYRRQELITNGIFSICRNPLFAVVIFLLLPGILLLFNSWLLLTIPCFAYIMFKLFIGREERLMEKAFRQKYVEYKNNTPALFPKIWKWQRSGSDPRNEHDERRTSAGGI